MALSVRRLSGAVRDRAPGRGGSGQREAGRAASGREQVLMGQPVTLERTPSTIARAAPKRGEHTEEILAELGYDPASVAATSDRHWTWSARRS